MTAAELREKSLDELQEELISLRREQFKVRVQHATGEQVRPHQHGRIRKNIARVKTVIAEQQRAASAEVTK